jgi:beta-glucosidase
MIVQFRMDAKPVSAVALSMASPGKTAAVPITGILQAAPIGEWKSLAIPLKCFVTAGVDPHKVTEPLIISTAGKLTLSISDVRLAHADGPVAACPTS